MNVHQQLHFSPEMFGQQGRTLKCCFVTDPIASLAAYKDSSVAMMRAAERRGHEVYVIESQTLYWRRPDAPGDTGVHGEAIYLYTHLDDQVWYREAGRQVLPLSHFDVVLMRKDPPFDQNYLMLTWLLERAEADGVRVFNRPAALRDHSEKLSISEFPQFAVPTLVTRNIAQLNAFVDEHERVVLKPLYGMGGRGIVFVGQRDVNRNVLIETLTADGREAVMAQAYIPQIKEGDKRILLVAGQVVPFALARIPKPGELRGNLAAGAKGMAQHLSSRDREIGEALAGLLYRRGLIVVGIDVIGDYLTEINVTSPTGLVEIAQQTGFDAANMLMLALEQICQ